MTARTSRKGLRRMKCQICNRKTDWDSSVGYIEFIVCNACERKLRKVIQGDTSTMMSLIFACGEIRKEVSK